MKLIEPSCQHPGSPDLLESDASGWSASSYNKAAHFVYSSIFTKPVLELLAAQPGERIIDFGCGTGEVTLEIGKMVEGGAGGVVVGVDFSTSMIAKAKANGLKHAFVANVESLEHPIDGSLLDHKFDAVFSNAALHWCKRNPASVLESAKSVLKKGGRFVGEMGGFMNCIGVRSVLHQVLRSRGYDVASRDPWYFPSTEDYVKLLVAASFKPTHLSLTPRITPLSTGLYDWLHLFARNTFLRDIPDNEARDILEEVVDICRIDCQDEGGKWAMTYMRLRFSAILT